MEALREKIRSRDERIQEEQEQKEKDRIEAAREKNRDREEKLSSVKAAEQDMKEKRQEKILQKQEDAAKRYIYFEKYCNLFSVSLSRLTLLLTSNINKLIEK